VIFTPPNGHQILPGTTRDVVTELSRRLAVRKVTAPISETALRGADELWLAMATRGVLPVTKLDGAPVGNGRPGPLFKRMNGEFSAYILELAGTPPL
jgi:D-alanine transaminase